MRLNKTGKIVLALLVLILIVAWIDGGRERQHLIVQPVTLPGAGR
jgi:hypothetical protein